jgi:PAS domain S-box-containing protein
MDATLAMTNGKNGGSEAGQAQHESERAFRLLVEGVVDYAIFMVDPEGTITTWNAGAERIKGYSASEAIGQYIGIFYTPEEISLGVPERGLEIARREGRFSAEGWRVRKDGSRFLASVVIDAIHENGKLIGFAKITRDVSEREAAHGALVDSERNFRTLVRGVTDYALYMLDVHGNVSSWNSGGEKIKGYTPKEIVGQHFSRFYTEPDRANGKPERALAIAVDKGTYQEEGYRVRKDGSLFFASVVIDPIYSDDGELVGFAKITRDISERRKAGLAMQSMQKQLAEAQKMEALGQLTGGVAHDFNNLLMIVSGNLETLRKGIGSNPRLARAVDAISIASQRGSVLTRQLLTFARRQHVEPQTVSVADRIDEIREVLASGLRGNVRLETRISPEAWSIKVDPNEFEIALLNLVVNAKDAMPNGGTILIKSENVFLEAAGDLPAGEYLSLAVADNGEGIPEDVLDSVFDPFFTTKGVGKGTGLGLSQVHGFVHQAGGSIKITSTVGKGTIVNLCLPRSSDNAHEERKDQSVTALKAAAHLLLVEDNPDVASATTQMLEQLGFTVSWASNAEGALEEMGRFSFDVVLSDIVMPGGMNGLDLARTIRQTDPGMPVILVTGYSDNAGEASAEFPMLRKPYGIGDLNRLLGAVSWPSKNMSAV